ncbi:helix-turn-helix transcriptional regulator [Serratia sp. D1N4]
MRKKRVVLQCPCNFMRVGLENLINDTQLSHALDIVGSTNNLAECENILNALPVVDFVILTISNREQNLASLLQLIGQDLLKKHPNSQVILIGNMAYMSLLKCYFGGLGNVRVILDNTMSLDELKMELLSLIFPWQGREITSIMLSSRELQVLRMLLDGDTAKQIAKELQLDFRTISHYKRAALTKLGARSLHPLVSLKKKNILKETFITEMV